MRRMSFSATIEPMRNKTKTVTRRNPETWKNLKPGDRLLAIEKGMGLKPGEKQIPIGVIEIVSSRVEPFKMYELEQPSTEGFKSWLEFKIEWCRLGNKWDPEQMVRRIEFSHKADSNQTKET